MNPDEKAEALLLRYLNPEQAADFRKKRHFWVRKSWSSRYLLLPQTTVHYRYGWPNYSFCFVSYDESGAALPQYDDMLARKLLLEANERLFRKTANKRMSLPSICGRRWPFLFPIPSPTWIMLILAYFTLVSISNIKSLRILLEHALRVVFGM